MGSELQLLGTGQKSSAVQRFLAESEGQLTFAGGACEDRTSPRLAAALNCKSDKVARPRWLHW